MNLINLMPHAIMIRTGSEEITVGPSCTVARARMHVYKNGIFFCMIEIAETRTSIAFE